MCQRLGRTPQWAKDQLLDQSDNWSSTPAALEGPLSHRVTTLDAELTMGPTEFRLLQYFMSHAERAYTRGQLLDQVWGGNVYVDERTVDVHIRRLRKALGDEHKLLIQTVRGTGYRFSTKVNETDNT